MFNQSVLLKNVNDNKKDLYELNHLLLKNKVVPYYLHQLDDVKGANHFKVDIKKGKNLLKELKKEMSDFMIFKNVKEIPFEKNKTLISYLNFFRQ
jgi:L-lysine 2,3-aminomutase